MKQLASCTVRSPIRFDDIGVHSGTVASLTLYPASENTGIVIEHISYPGDAIMVGSVIPEHASHATVLRARQWSISTIEHFMAALHGLGIDNCRMVVEQEEAPILDGSSLVIAQRILQTGLVAQDHPKRYVQVAEPLVLTDGDKVLEILPPAPSSTDLVVSYAAQFDNPLLGAIEVTETLNNERFMSAIAPARTFGFLAQWPMLKKMGLALGSSLENTLVIGDNGFVNQPRLPHEWARHKVLDLIGDLFLLGRPLRGIVRARGTGHASNRAVIAHFVEHPEQWITF